MAGGLSEWWQRLVGRRMTAEPLRPLTAPEASDDVDPKGSGLSREQLRATRTVLRRPWQPPRTEADIRHALSWFGPLGAPDELVRWFLIGDGQGAQYGALSLDAALDWRRQLLSRDVADELPLREHTAWLPLIRLGDSVLLYDARAPQQAGRAGSVRRYHRAHIVDGQGAPPLALVSLLVPPGPEPGAPRSAVLSQAFYSLHTVARQNGWETTAKHELDPLVDQSAAALSRLCPSRRLAEWFAAVGPTSQQMMTHISSVAAVEALSLQAAIVWRDELLEGAPAALADQLHRQSWMPVLRLATGDALLWFKRGDEWDALAFHVVSPTLRPGVWTRQVGSTDFLMHLATFTGMPFAESASLIARTLASLDEEHWAKEVPRRGIDTFRLEQLPRTLQGGLRAWFAGAPTTPFADAGERLLSLHEAHEGLTDIAGRPGVPLLKGPDGVDTYLVEGLGIVLTRAGYAFPLLRDLETWVKWVWMGSLERVKQRHAVQITRSYLSGARIEFAMRASELAMRLRTLEAGPLELASRDLKVIFELKEQSMVSSSLTALHAALTPADRDTVVNELEAVSSMALTPLRWSFWPSLTLVVSR